MHWFKVSMVDFCVGVFSVFEGFFVESEKVHPAVWGYGEKPVFCDSEFTLSDFFNVKQGWKPLCEFLDVPVPEGIPFPHVHTRAKLEGEMFFLRMITWIWPLVLMILLHGAISLLGRPKLSPLDKTRMLSDASNPNDDLVMVADV